MDKQELQEIRNNIFGELKRMDDLIAGEEPKEGLSNLEVKFVTGDVVELSFDNKSEKEIDIQYKHEEGNWISVQGMIRNPDIDPPPLEVGQESYTIWLGKDGEWAFHVGVGEWEDDENYFVFHKVPLSETITKKPKSESEPTPEPIEDFEPLNLDIGFWYSEEVPDNELKSFANIGQSRSAGMELMQPVVDSGLKVVPSIGGFLPNETESEHRKRVGWYTDRFENIGYENIGFVILRDEPTKLSVTQMTAIVDEANKEFGELEPTFMFTRGMLMRRQFPKNLKRFGCNLYPFFEFDAPDGYVQVWNYDQFKEHADKVFNPVRDSVPNARFTISPQVFYTQSGDGNPWREPPIESAEWYFRYALESGDIDMFLLWEWESSEQWTGLHSMPRLQKAWVDAYEKYIS